MHLLRRSQVRLFHDFVSSFCHKLSAHCHLPAFVASPIRDNIFIWFQVSLISFSRRSYTSAGIACLKERSQALCSLLPFQNNLLTCTDMRRVHSSCRLYPEQIHSPLFSEHASILSSASSRRSQHIFALVSFALSSTIFTSFHKVYMNSFFCLYEFDFLIVFYDGLLYLSY